MSWQDDAMIEQENADALWNMGEAEWRDTYNMRRVGRPRKSEEEKKQKRKEYNAKYWSEHSKEINRSRRVKYKEDKDKFLDRNKRWFKKNRDKWNEYQREYRKRKRESIDKSKEA